MLFFFLKKKEFDHKSKPDRLTKKDIKQLVIRLIGKDNEKELNKNDMKLLIEKV